MNTTTAQGVRCGNHGKDRVYHVNGAEVRACYSGHLTRDGIDTTPVATPGNADEARSEAMRRLANQTSPFGTRPVYPASDKQVAFVQDLALEVLVDQARDALLARLDILTHAEAKQLITDMLVMRTSQRAMKAAQPVSAPPAAPSQPAAGWRSMIDRVMLGWPERNLAIEDAEGKTRFYRISKRGKNSSRPGTWKIQERVTDMLLPRHDSLMTTVLPAILAMGVEASGLMFAQRMHRCYKCGASLTDDTGNPYYSAGLGPDCGSK